MTSAVLLLRVFLGSSASPSATSAATLPVTQGGSLAERDSLSKLIRQLSHVRGEFGFSDMTQTWEFIGDEGALNAFGDFSDSAVVRLVDCLDAGTPTLIRVRDRQALLGVLCYTALRRVAYVERPPGPKPWAGVVAADATVEQLRRAKIAWQEVVKKKLYRLL